MELIGQMLFVVCICGDAMYRNYGTVGAFVNRALLRLGRVASNEGLIRRW